MLEVSILILFIIEVLIILWTNNAKPSKKIILKYSKSTILKTMIPFYPNWNKNIESKDIDIFMIYRKRFHVLVFSFVLLFIAYAYELLK